MSEHTSNGAASPANNSVTAAIDLGARLIASAIYENFSSPNVPDENYEAANVVDVLAKLSRSIFALAKAITEHGRRP
jgi:hypothetical protein